MSRDKHTVPQQTIHSKLSRSFRRTFHLFLAFHTVTKLSRCAIVRKTVADPLSQAAPCDATRFFFVTMSFFCSVAAFLLIGEAKNLESLQKPTNINFISAGDDFVLQFHKIKLMWKWKEKWISKGILWHSSRKLLAMADEKLADDEQRTRNRQQTLANTRMRHCLLVDTDVY